MISGDEYGIVHRLLLNETVLPSPEGLFRILGFIHLYSASGLHLMALENFLQRFLGRTLAARKILTVFFLFFLLVVWKLQGFRLGFARILILFFLKAHAREQGLRWRIYYPLFLAFCFDFAVGIDAGWLHYYLAILGGMLGLELSRERSPFMQHLYLSVASWLMTAPLDLWEHHSIAWMTPLWSMITIPPIAFFLYPVSVLSYFFFGSVPSAVMDLWNTGVGLVLKFVDLGFTFSALTGQFVLISLLCSLLTSFMFYRFKQFRERLLLVTVAVFLALSSRFHFSDGKMFLVQLDVGQGDSLLISRGDRVEMIDLGSARDQKPEVMVQRLARFGIVHVDTVLFSHLDEDHAGGLKMLLPWVPVSSLEMNPKLERTARIRDWIQDFPETSFCSDGCFQLGSVDSLVDRSDRSGNERMATAIIPLSSSEVYLALGDANSLQESVFWGRHHEEIFKFSRRILKVSHHGSRFSSSGDFLRDVNPVLAVISVGRRNHYHHPSFRVVEQLLENRIPIHRTDQDGDFVWIAK